jgi:diguanylate cyclase (GGDEF)-like protein/PAS domain S-box-containing protein
MTPPLSQRPRVLLIDDDRMTRLLVRKALENSDMTVDEAHDGGEGLELFRAQRPDIVLLDLIMPGLDGFSVCRAMREIPDGQHVPILMMTGLDDAESIEHAYEAGATDFITKPITLPLLGHRLRYMLRASRAFLDLTKSQASLANAQRIAALGSWDWDLRDDTIVWSEETFRICGLNPGQTIAGRRAFLQIVHPEDVAQVEHHLSMPTKVDEWSGLDHRIVLPDGSERVVHTQGVPAFDDSGKIIRISGTLQDITERRRAEEEIRRLAFYDTLTGLPNLEWFKEMFNRAEARVRRNDGQQMAFLCIDLDRFKRVNDTLGHSFGDLLLKAVAGRLQGCVRRSDALALQAKSSVAADLVRLGGDEFTVLLDDFDTAQGAVALALRVMESMAEPFSIGEQELAVSVSVGIAVYPNDGTTFESLLKNASSALYYAKEQGRNNFQFYTHSMNATAREKLDLENRLRKALERGELALHYQPKVDLNTGHIFGVEALMRWREPELGAISPARFIPVAEETGLIVPIGEWALRTACAQTKAWQLAGYSGLSVAVNLSARQFRKENAPLVIRNALAESGLAPEHLELELTESLLMHDDTAIIAALVEMKTIGVTLSLDDFGTGYSSLSYLRRFPIDIVKIDQAFTRDLELNTDAAALTRAIIAMARSLAMKTVAEGVETEGQLEFLRDNNCDAMQGYYFSRPLPANELTALLQSGKHIPPRKRGGRRYILASSVGQGLTERGLEPLRKGGVTKNVAG